MRIQPSSPPASPAPPPNRPDLHQIQAPSRAPNLLQTTSPPSSPPPAASSVPAPSNPIIDRIKSAQSALASNPILRSLSNRQDGEEEPDDAKTHRSVGVDPDFYDMVDENVLSILLDACKPLFELVSGTDDPDSKNSTMKPADLLMSTAKLIIAAGFKMKEQARQDMAEEDLGGGMFDQDVKNMRDFASKVASEPQVYDADERQQLDVTLVRFNTEISLKKYKTGTKLYDAEITDTGEVRARLKLDVRAPPEQIVSYYMGHTQQFVKHHKSYGGGSGMGERRNNHSLIAGGTLSMPQPFQNRLIVIKILWEKLDKDTFFVSQVPSTHDSIPLPKNVVRTTNTRLMKLTRIGPSLTKCEMLGSMNLNGSIPARINKIVTLPLVTRQPISLINYFTSVRPADAFNEGDGKVLGQLLFLKLHKHRKNKDLLTEKILEMIRTTNVLRAAQAKYRFFDELLFHVIRNKMRNGAVQTSFAVATPLVALTANEAGRISRSFIVVMMANATPQSAVDEHIGKFLALRELDREFVWSRPMMEAIAMELMKDVAVGVKLRAGLGAALSLMDMVSDSIIIRDLFKTPGKAPFAKALLACLAFNIAWQLVIVLCQSYKLKKNRLRTMLLESLAVVTFVKPGLDAWRVASGQEEQPGAYLNPMKEMAYSKGTEMFAEAIPGFVIQAVALVTSKEKSLVAVGSLLVSAMTTAMTAASSFYDLDTDPGSRRSNPGWIGLIPDQARTKAFLVLLALSFCQVLAKGVAMALLAVTDVRTLLYYIVGDVGLSLAHKVAVNDFHQPFPLPWAASFVVSLVVRIMYKTIADFTGSPLYRLPTLLGGTTYCFTLVTSQISVLVAVHLYNKNFEAGADQAKLDASSMWQAATTMVIAWVCLFAYFVLRVAVPTKRWTLWSRKTGRQYVVESYTKGESDEKKFAFFRRNKILWEKEIGGQVREWTMANWATWERERPEWFTAKAKSAVPDSYIPGEFLAGLGGANRVRRGSAAESVRESFRAASVREDAEG
ncbi:hypothetical protein TeGR_g5060 [Tetraparma gracilis]|uniref:Uncharacterized protein n=1 Tax=Tetraparma gracilis TaxID=2962635 RepID=A0ABQ6M6J3_9STRA|nr:hypothetical protein TeGR_g5060 [Tetraparma gracilis]